MKPPPENDLITIIEAAHILGFKQRSKVDILIKSGFSKFIMNPESRKLFYHERRFLICPMHYQFRLRQN